MNALDAIREERLAADRSEEETRDADRRRGEDAFVAKYPRTAHALGQHAVRQLFVERVRGGGVLAAPTRDALESLEGGLAQLEAGGLRLDGPETDMAAVSTTLARYDPHRDGTGEVLAGLRRVVDLSVEGALDERERAAARAAAGAEAKTQSRPSDEQLGPLADAVAQAEDIFAAAYGDPDCGVWRAATAAPEAFVALLDVVASASARDRRSLGLPNLRSGLALFKHRLEVDGRVVEIDWTRAIRKDALAYAEPVSRGRAEEQVAALYAEAEGVARETYVATRDEIRRRFDALEANSGSKNDAAVAPPRKRRRSAKESTK